jgi:acetyl-CoA carboxylase, biotin carboxylase subunit
MFRRILIANRGEVAARVLRTCRRMGIQAVAVTTDADADLAWLHDADEVVNIGGRRAYLDADALLAAAQKTHCSAVHPGWGFLSENATFAARCEAVRLSFIGPRPRSMREMGNKAVGRATMLGLGLPPIPGTDGVLDDVLGARDAARDLGYPVLLKALAGGGGRGMRKVYAEADLEQAFDEATAESQGAFGDGRLYMEKLIENGRHIEFQLLGDGQGGVRVLGARECSVQRRHQKLIEETPSTAVSPDIVEQTADRIAAAVGALRYRGAGTMEMLRDADGALWFMEMNTRLQVEHTITEAVTGIDLVEWQLRVAANEGLGDLDVSGAPGGHAIECRLNAEDPALNFQPRPGAVTALRLPEGEGVRVDTHLREGDKISPHYDSMFAKIITHGADRPAAIARMGLALDALTVEGVPTTRDLHRAVIAHPDFVAGTYDTGWLERTLPSLLSSSALSSPVSA